MASSMKFPDNVRDVLGDICEVVDSGLRTLLLAAFVAGPSSSSNSASLDALLTIIEVEVVDVVILETVL